MNYTTTTSGDTSGGTYFYPPPCPSCGYCHEFGSPCLGAPRMTIGTIFKQEKPVQDNLIDKSLADELTAMRDKRDSAARYAQAKNDMASLYEAAAVFLRTQAAMMYREINEGVPMTPDPK